jgi:hypothetical protein
VFAAGCNQSIIEDRLFASKAGNTNIQITVTEMDGSFIASTFPYSLFINYTAANRGISTNTNLSSINAELAALENSVLAMGGWSNIRNVNSYTYTSPSIGLLQVSLSVYSFPNRNWYVFVTWPAVILFKILI